MSRVASLLWKEWHEARAFLWIGLGLFLGMPAVACLMTLGHTNTHLDFEATPWVVPLGGVLAVFVAVGVTTRDLRPHVADFWQSRPIRVGPWLAVKYAVALAVVLLACGLPLTIELAVDRPSDTTAGSVLAYFPFYWTAIFSLAFAAGCLVARPAHAATLGLAAMLLVYVLPMVLPPLAWLTLPDLGGALAREIYGPADWRRPWGRRPLAFAAGMLGVAAVAAALGAVGVARGWRVESGRRTLYGLVAAAALLLFASAAFQLGTNLPVLQRIELPAGEAVVTTAVVGEHGYVITEDRSGPWARPLQYRSLQISAGGLTLGSPDALTPAAAEVFRPNWTAVIYGGVVYRAWDTDVTGSDGLQQQQLRTVSLGAGHVVGWLELWRKKPMEVNPELFLWGDRLYAFGGGHLAVVDLSTPGRPRVIANGPFVSSGYRRGLEAGDVPLRCDLIPLPGVPPIGRAKATLWNFDGRLLCLGAFNRPDTAFLYRLTTLTDRTASFVPIGQYRPTLLQRAINGETGGSVGPDNGFVYVSGGSFREVLDSGTTVLDARGPGPVRPVGHFAAPDGWQSFFLPDGRVVVGGGRTLWLFGPPRSTAP